MLASMDTVTMEGPELQVRVRALAPSMAGRIESTADAVMAETEDRRIKITLLRWKMQAIPEIYEAAFNPDPGLALVDTWAFTVQLRNAVADQDFREVLGLHQETVSRAVAEIEKMVREVVSDAAGGAVPANGEKIIEQWASDNEFLGLTFHRESIESFVADRIAAGPVEGLSAIGALPGDIRDVARRLDILQEYLPKQARWQVEYLLTEYEDDLDGIVAGVDQLARAAESLNGLLEDSDEIAGKGRAELRSLVGEQQERLKDTGEILLAKAFEHLAREREVVLLELREERQAVLEEVSRQRQETIDILRQERMAMAKEIGRIADEIVAASAGRAEETVDHAFLRLAQLMAVAFGLTAILVFVAVRQIRQPSGGVSR
jgi:hypothetical protein